MSLLQHKVCIHVVSFVHFRDEMLRGLEDLVRRRPDLDRIVVETSGMADPCKPYIKVFSSKLVAALVHSLWADEELDSPVLLDGVVCLVDAVNTTSDLLMTSSEAFNQIGLADLILLNKVDSAKNPVFIDELEHQIR